MNAKIEQVIAHQKRVLYLARLQLSPSNIMEKENTLGRAAELEKQRDQLLAAAKAAMVWWEEHQYDTTGDRGEWNVFDDEPAFVTASRAAIAAAEQPAPAPASSVDQLNEIAKLRGYSPEWAAKVLAACGARVARDGDAAGWIEWKGGECPVSPECFVDVGFRNSARQISHAGYFNWAHRNQRWDIIAYRVVQEGA